MSTFDQVFERIKLAINTRTQVQLAEVLDIRQSSISDAKRRDSVPAEWYLKLFKKFGLNPDWLEEGIGPWYLKNKHGEYVTADGPADAGVMAQLGDYAGAENKGTVVTVHSMQVEGEEPSNWAPVPIGKLNVPQSYAKNSIQVIKMGATSMEPLVKKGAFIGVDTSKKHVESGELYMIYIPYEGLTLKRVFLDLQGSKYILRTENSAHPEQHLPVDKRQDCIYGRAVWILQEL